MAENAMDQIVAELRQIAPATYPERGELRNVRVVGHTPKTGHYIYDIVVDFAGGSERLAAKIYRPGKNGAAQAKASAQGELASLAAVYKIFEKKKLKGVPRPVGNFTELGAVVAEKFSGLSLQSIVMKAALLPGFDDRGGLALAAQRTGEWLHSFHKATAEMPNVDTLPAAVRLASIGQQRDAHDSPHSRVPGMNNRSSEFPTGSGDRDSAPTVDHHHRGLTAAFGVRAEPGDHQALLGARQVCWCGRSAAVQFSEL